VSQKNPEERLPAKELLKHRIFKNARKTSCLVELIDKHKKWKDTRAAGTEKSSSEEEHRQDKPTDNGPIWKFNDTVKGAPEMTPEPPKEVPVPVPVPVPAKAPVDEKPPAGVSKKTREPPRPKTAEKKPPVQNKDNSKKKKNKTKSSPQFQLFCLEFNYLSRLS